MLLASACCISFGLDPGPRAILFVTQIQMTGYPLLARLYIFFSWLTFCRSNARLDAPACFQLIALECLNYDVGIAYIYCKQDRFSLSLSSSSIFVEANRPLQSWLQKISVFISLSIFFHYRTDFKEVLS
jgi:hypothetical protein